MKRFTLLSAALTAAGSMWAIDYTVAPDGSSVNVDGKCIPLTASTVLLSHDAPDAPHVYRSANEALMAIESSGTSNGTILVTPWVYWLDDPDDPATRYMPRPGTVPFGQEVACDTLSVIGLADNPRDVVWAVNRGQTQGALGNYTMLHFTGRSLSFENITLGNYCNCDLEYPLAPQLNRPRRRDAIVQAQIGLLDGCDRLYARNVHFLSRLNLCPLINSRRSLYKDCYFECTDDALTGSGLYVNCGFTFFSGKPFYSTDATGAIFLDCDIRCLTDDIQYLTKAPGLVTMIDTRFTADHPVTLQWTRDESAIRCLQSGLTFNGQPVTIDAGRPHLWADITGSSLLKAFKITMPDGRVIYNTPNLLAGDDGWDPLGMLPAVREAEGILGEKLMGLPVALKVEASKTQLTPKGDTAVLTAMPRRWGDYDCPGATVQVAWKAPSTVALQTASAGRVKAVSDNRYPQAAVCNVEARTPEGLASAAELNVEPYLLDAPRFTKAPAITAAKQCLKVEYGVPDTGESDDSYIIWYRSTRPDHADTTAVRHGHGMGARTYPLGLADKGCYISAMVYPRLANTRQGAGVYTTLQRAVSGSQISILPRKESSLYTTWAEVPVRRSAPGRKGYWQFDAYKPGDTNAHNWQAHPELCWYYGNGHDAAAQDVGLVQATQGARLSYLPVRDKCHSMTLTLTAAPCKGPGQGFGSATKQYMDVCVKFDPVTLTGYALRIERTPDYDKAVTFTLMRYDNGTATPITEPVATSAYRNPCTINLNITDTSFSATASTQAPAVKVTNPTIQPTVMLSAPISSPSGNCGLMIQHTGTTGPSATLLRDIKVQWD